MRAVIMGAPLLAVLMLSPAVLAQDGESAQGLDKPVTTEPVYDDGGEEQEEDDHEGFFFRFALGLGWGWLRGDGTLPPAKGIRAIEDPEHDSPVFNMALSLGGGFLDLALHVGVVYERMILRDDSPTEMGFTLMGIGGGLTYYFTDFDFYATAQIRLMGLMMYMKDVVCDSYCADKYEWYRGPGIALTLGKEWFEEEKDRGVGLGIQFNWAHLTHDDDATISYTSLLLLLTVTKF